MAQSVGSIALDIVMGRNTVTGVARQAMQDVQRVFNDSSATIGNKVSAVGTACKQIGSSLMPVSLAAQGVIKSTADAAMSFETAMAQVKTIAGDASVSYKGDMTDMSKAIMALSKDTGIAAEDIAGATYGAISAGVDASKSVEFVATANALAVGGFADMSTAVDVLTTTMNAYGEKAGTAESISDKLITTQNLGKTTVNELASSMGKVIPTASAYGVSVDNLCSSYVALTKGGIATAEATTYMKSMFSELGKSGSTVGKILQEQTGKSFGQLMADGYSLADVIDILGKSVNGDKEKFAQLWGSTEAGTGALAILNGGTDDFNNTLKEMGNSTGSASDALDKMNDTSAHKMQVAMNDLKNAAIELGGAFAPVMAGIASAVSKVASAFSNLPGPVKNTVAVILGVVAVAAPLLMIIGNVISAVGTIMGAVSGFIGFITGTVVPALSGFFSFLLANPIVLVITLIVAAVALLIKNWEDVKEVALFVWEQATEAWNNLKEDVVEICTNIGTKAVEIWGNIKEWVTEKVTAAKDAVVEKFDALKEKVSEIWTNIKDGITEKITAVKDFVEEKVTAIKDFFDEKITAIKDFVSEKWDNIKTKTSETWENIKDKTSTTWENVKETVTTKASDMKDKAVSAFDTLKSGIETKFTSITSSVKTGVSNAFSYVKDLPSSAWNWGKDIIDGLVKGIKSCITKVGDTAKAVASKITSFLHFSRPDEGPLREYEKWMPDFMQGMAKGIIGSKGKVVNAVKSLSKDMASETKKSQGTKMISAVSNKGDFLDTINSAKDYAIKLEKNKKPALPEIFKKYNLTGVGANGVRAEAPKLKNTGTNTANDTNGVNNDKIYDLLMQIIRKMDTPGNITIPIHLGNDLIDEIVLRANTRRALRSGGRA